MSGAKDTSIEICLLLADCEIKNIIVKPSEEVVSPAHSIADISKTRAIGVTF